MSTDRGPNKFQPIRGRRVRNGVLDGERDRIPLAPYLLCEIWTKPPAMPVHHSQRLLHHGVLYRAGEDPDSRANR
ncbi:hypothetical protein OPV22_009151 [Ensete ventricosum]|uniref:Uncharacterized protein n=1 Tax=Ensete ventricosum TaxID=4639 RepID=A0AAV8RGB3_ENSVE|nr:hypothetical protein OPV22_009151 [Ensete ventricosum]RWW30605.1 hypothetical protein GW17_00004813 [Ensete ventricosum]RZR77425.1 hypothetical protein BHM03_00002492 [Ensete ventricosum]